MASKGFKPISMHWTLGRYDAILISEAPNEKVIMETMIKYGEIAPSDSSRIFKRRSFKQKPAT